MSYGYIYGVDQQNYDLTVFTVATDRYILFWSEMVTSYLKSCNSKTRTQWIVFTDKEDQISPELIHKLGDSLLIVKITHREWPFPTLLRYEYLLSVSHKVQGRLLMHLDADMLFLDNIDFQVIEKSIGSKGIILVSHPGYYRPHGFRKINFYLRNLKYLIKDVKTIALYGGIGAWECNKSSLAFVPRKLRVNYVCGGVWIGRKNEIINLCTQLSSRIEEDLKFGIIASFHDESHLNWYQSVHSFDLLSPEFCFEPSYPQLRGLNPKILAVNKNAEKTWQR